MRTATCWNMVDLWVERYESMKESWPPQSQRFNMRSPRKRTWFCSTSIVAPRRAVKEAGLFELGQIEAGILGERRVGDRQDEGAHRGFPTSRRTHEQDLAAISGDYNGAQRRPTFFFIVLVESVFGHYPFGHLHFGHWTMRQDTFERIQSPRPNTPEPAARQGHRNTTAIQLLDSDGSISVQVGFCMQL